VKRLGAVQGKKRRSDATNEEIIEACERELDTVRHLNRQHLEVTRDAWRRDRQVLIERRRKPR